jgi:hypothetical protein
MYVVKPKALLAAVGFSLAFLAIPSTAHAGLFGGGTSLSTAKSLIRSTVYGYTQNCKSSFKACSKYVIAHDYPGYLLTAKANACVATEAPFTGSATVDLSSVAPDKKWTMQPPLVADENPGFVGKVPKGDTFIATLNFEYDMATGQVSKSSADAHFTILNNVAYFYFTICTK